MLNPELYLKIFMNSVSISQKKVRLNYKDKSVNDLGPYRIY